jgi:hypothetical protein
VTGPRPEANGGVGCLRSGTGSPTTRAACWADGRLLVGSVCRTPRCGATSDDRALLLSRECSTRGRCRRPPGEVRTTNDGFPIASLFRPIYAYLQRAEHAATKRVRRGVKVCSKCRQKRPMDNFNAEGRARDGHRADCRECQHETARSISRRPVAERYSESRRCPTGSRRQHLLAVRR